MNVETSSQSMDHPLVARICRFMILDKVALTFAAIFLFGVMACAAVAAVAIGDAPQGRMWSFLVIYAALGLMGIAVPWALCRMLHAAGHAARFARERRATRPQEALSLSAFLQGRTA